MYFQKTRRCDHLSGVVGAYFFFVATYVSATTLNVVPSTQTVAPGDVVEVGIEISDLGDFAPDSLGAFDLEITYDSAVLSFTNATFGDPALGDRLDLSGLGSITDVIPGTGVVEVLEVSLDDPFDLDSLQPGTFELVTLTFTTTETGTSPLNITVIDLGDAFGDPLVTTSTNGSVNVVPVPAAIYLFGSGIFGVLGIAVNRRRLNSNNCIWTLNLRWTNMRCTA